MLTVASMYGNLSVAYYKMISKKCLFPSLKEPAVYLFMNKIKIGLFMMQRLDKKIRFLKITCYTQKILFLSLYNKINVSFVKISFSFLNNNRTVTPFLVTSSAMEFS